MFLLDTNVVSELRKKGEGGDAPVAAWARSIEPGLLYLSAISVLELEIGVLRLERRDPRQAAPLRRWLEAAVMGVFAGRILGFDAEAARRCAPLHVPNPLPDRDSIIAAIALVHGMTVVTRNVRDFASTGVRLLNPWESQPG